MSDAHEESHRPWYEEVALPVLLDAGRRRHGAVMREALAEAGFDDLPRLGPRLVGGIARNGAGLTEFSRVLGTSKQRAGQLVDTLVARGYLDRRPHPDDGRRIVICLTPRGEAAADVIRTSLDAADAALVAAVGAEDVATMRRVLGTLVGDHAAAPAAATDAA
jgi:DNA-binding MarR family transcriptional regulator